MGNTFLQEEKIDDAISHYERALEIDPAYADAHNNLANALVRKGRARDALPHYDQALALDPNAINTRNNFAWLLATTPDPEIREAARAVELAEAANSLAGGGNAVVLRTLAAAYAAEGRFGNAVATTERATDLARSQGDTSLARTLEEERTRYEANAAPRKQ